MKILGIHDGHTSTAALVEDGQLTACVSEERLTGIKYDQGLPTLSINWIFNYTTISPADIDLVVLSYRINPLNRERFINEDYSDKFSIYKFGSLFNKILQNLVLLSINKSLKPNEFRNC